MHIAVIPFVLNLFFSFCENKNKVLDDDTPDPRFLTDGDLKAALLKHGIAVGPIVGEDAFNTAFILPFYLRNSHFE